MKRIILAIISLLSISKAYASYSVEMDVMSRNKRFRLKKQKMLLSNLISNNSFEGKNFKIVKGKSEDAILFTNKELRLKAATVYFHLEKARNYFIKNLNSSFVQSIPTTIIRIEHFNKFNELGHFANDNLEPQFNNALTIPEGAGYEPAGIKPWNTEIWFRPSKKIHISEIENSQIPIDAKKMLRTFRNGVHMSSLQKFLMDYFVIKIYGQLDRKASIEQFIRTTGTSIMLELALSQASLIQRLITRRWYLLESALIPEIIYHEYSHLALSDGLKLNQSTAVIEGMADFFAGKISNSKELATKVSKYNSFNGKRVSSTKLYQQEFESTSMANTDFLFGLLWQVNEIVQDESLIYDLRNKITTDSNIRDHLIKGIFELIDENPKYTQEIKLKLYRIFYLRGI